MNNAAKKTELPKTKKCKWTGETLYLYVRADGRPVYISIP